MELLPDDLLADVLGRLPPCDLAASRCVRKRWCGVADLLPLRLDGFFCLSVELDRLAHFFARPSTGRRVGGGLDFVDADEFDRPSILDHCNGLLLLPGLVVNPATRRCAPLPPFPDSRCGDDVEVYARRFLAFDPMASPPHYQVVSVPFVLRIEECMSGEEWPLLSYTAHVFSSRKGSSWEERTFVREGEAFGTCAGMLSDWTTNDRHAVYWRGVLYVHCQDYSVMRITLSNDKYQMIKSPAEKKQGVIAYLGKSEKGVYSALLWEDDGLPRFRVWSAA
ncbi:hypothetical protein QOZ80_9BG0693890 [Eleusine coracana subsp. coracana]|nr:hypothetical protein QOZ80_9BG0693890 [Eleusine coracana subsp. coracana]